MYERVGPGTEIKGEPHHPTPGTHISEFASEELGAPWHVFACNRRYRMLELASPREGNKPPHSLGGTGVVIGASRNVTSSKRQRNGGTMRRPACLPGAGSTIPAVGQIGYLPPSEAFAKRTSCMWITMVLTTRSHRLNSRCSLRVRGRSPSAMNPPFRRLTRTEAYWTLHAVFPLRLWTPSHKIGRPQSQVPCV